MAKTTPKTASRAPQARKAATVAQTAARTTARTEAPPEAPPAAEGFPVAMYRKRKVSEKYPNGYEARRVETPEELSRLDGKLWKDTPVGMYEEKVDEDDDE